ncbi:hypothetical protein ACQEVF_02535 [Nonomuraea polychroma]|uniref:hypothetical protein n=1 Tax=Nonomuraea polychroma TaxID=46176 RepID=UPI003D8FC25C
MTIHERPTCARGFSFPDRSGTGTVSVRGGGVAIDIRQGPAVVPWGNRFQAGGGTWVDLDGLTGRAEEARNRW